MSIFKSRWGNLEIDAMKNGGINISLSWYNGDSEYGFSAYEYLSPKQAVELYKKLGEYLALEDKKD